MHQNNKVATGSSSLKLKLSSAEVSANENSNKMFTVGGSAEMFNNARMPPDPIEDEDDDEEAALVFNNS